jgi:molybdopterin molybdotransferase
MGVLAALGRTEVSVYKRPVVAVISSGDEIVPVDQTPALSELRDVNSHTLSALVLSTGGDPLCLGIAGDDPGELGRLCRRAVTEADMVLISGGSSVGSRDYTLEVLNDLPESRVLVHGVSVSPGKPTILARSEGRILWGLPGQVTSAMVVFQVMVRPSIQKIAGLVQDRGKGMEIPAVLSRNVASVQGRTDFVRVRLRLRDGKMVAEPILGKSGLLHTMVKADGMIRIEKDSEGLDQGEPVAVIPF